jgi:hypothetical protein
MECEMATTAVRDAVVSIYKVAEINSDIEVE